MKLSRYWNYTTCIEFDRLNILETRITELLEKEYGCHRLSKLPKLSCDLKNSSKYPEEELTNLWIVCLFKGIHRWTVIKTFPPGLMCGRASQSDQPRLTNLTKQIKCNAFHLEVYLGSDGFLFESDAMGNTFLSGSPPLGDYKYFRFHDEPQVEQTNEIDFFLIDVPESLKQAIRINESPETQEEEARIEEARIKGLDSEAADYEHFELVQNQPAYTERIDDAMADLFDPNRDFWIIAARLAYLAYYELEKLKSIGAKILYFHPPDSYQPFSEQDIDFSQDVDDDDISYYDEVPF